MDVALTRENRAHLRAVRVLLFKLAAITIDPDLDSASCLTRQGLGNRTAGKGEHRDFDGASRLLNEADIDALKVLRRREEDRFSSLPR